MSRSIPLPGQAPLPAPDAAELFRRNAASPEIGGRPAIRFGSRVWTHAEVAAEGCRFAHLLLAHRPPAASGRATHVGVLLDNTPDYLFTYVGAAFAGATVVGLNPTRVGEHLLRDLTHTDVDVIITEPSHVADLAGLDLGGRPVFVSHRFDETTSSTAGGADDLAVALAAVSGDDPGISHDPDTTWALVFTSGTSGAPKAVVCSQRRLLVTGARMAIIMDIGRDDVGYVAMPLFHSNSVMVGWMPSVVTGASIGLVRKFTVSGFLSDVRRFGSTYFNYTGKPLSYLLGSPEQPDDADNPLRVAFGNEGSPRVLTEFSRRFGLEVIDAFGSTEGAVALNREGTLPPGAMGRAGDSIRILDEAGEDCEVAEFAADGTLLNADRCVGEIVNTAGAGPFEGYYNNDEATAKATRNGWYWSGDLGYLDADRCLYFAGRTAEWIRVDGENFPAGPIAEALGAHPDVVIVAAYGVPDADAGDQVMAALVLRNGATFDPVEFAAWLDGDAGIGPKWKPRYVRVATELPTTGTNKIVTRTLARQRFRREEVGSDPIWIREKGDAAYRAFGEADEAELRSRFAANGRERFWEL